MSDERPESLAAQAASWVPPWERSPRAPDPDYAAAHQAPDDDDDEFEDQAADATRAVDAPLAVDAPRAAGGLRVADGMAGVRAAEAETLQGQADLPADARGYLEDDGERLSAAGLAEDDDFDPAFEGTNPGAADPGSLGKSGAGAASEAGTGAAGAADPGALGQAGTGAAGAAGPEALGQAGTGAAGEADTGALGEARAVGEAGTGTAGRDGVPGELPPIPGEGSGPATVDAPLEVAGEAEPEPTDVGSGPELPLPEAIGDAAENETGASSLVDAPLPPEGDDAGDVFDQAADDDVADDAEVDFPVTEEVPEADDGADAADDDADAADSDADAGPASDEASASDATSAGGGAPDAAGAPAGVEAGAGEVTAGAVVDAGNGVVGGSSTRAKRAGSSGVPAQGRRRKGDAVAVVSPVDRTDEEPELKPLEEGELRSALEAILLVVDEPVAEMQLAQITEQTTERIARALEDISARYTAAGNGFDLRRAAGGWRLYTRPEYAAYVERFVLDGQSVRLTQAALETLAVVAYKQPVTRSRISAIRGVNCDGVMRTLVTRGLIEECGTEVETGAFLYRTTALFLEKLGLNSVDQLPPLAPFLPDDVEEVLDASG